MQFDKSITATVYIVENNKVLLHMHKKYKTQFPVGGHVESDEFPYQAAIREAKEESGFDVELVKTEIAENYDIGRVERIPMPFCTYQCGSEKEFYDFSFIATIKSGELSPADGESTEFRWFGREELEKTNEVKVHIRNTALAVLDYTINSTIPNKYF